MSHLLQVFILWRNHFDDDDVNIVYHMTDVCNENAITGLSKNQVLKIAVAIKWSLTLSGNWSVWDVDYLGQFWKGLFNSESFLIFSVDVSQEICLCEFDSFTCIRRQFCLCGSRFPSLL